MSDEQEWHGKFDELHAAATNLANRLRQIHDDPAYMGVWEIAQSHLGPYTGPQYAGELEALEKLL